jgi:hypothetical protein
MSESRLRFSPEMMSRRYIYKPIRNFIQSEIHTVIPHFHKISCEFEKQERARNNFNNWRRPFVKIAVCLQNLPRIYYGGTATDA